MSWRERLHPALPPPMPAPPREGTLARLDLNEGAFAPTAVEAAALRRALDACRLNRYPDDSAGALREALAARWNVQPEEILVGNGSIELIACLLTAFGRPGAEILYPVPTFDQYAALAAARGVGRVAVPLLPDFSLDEARLAAAIDDRRPALAFFASPNNPTGNTFDPRALVRLALRMEAAFVVDEAYADFAGETLLPHARATDGLFVLRTLSKIGLAGLRIGALVGKADAIAAIAPARLPFSVGAVSLALACAALAFPGAIDARVREIVRLRSALAADLGAVPGVRVYPSAANFLLVRLATDATETARRMRAHGVLVKDVSTIPLLDRCLRVTVGDADQNRRCVEALREALGVASLPLRPRRDAAPT